MFRTLTDSGCVILSVASVLVGAEGGGAAGRRPLVRGTDGGVDVRDGGEAFADWVYSEVANRIEDPWLTSAQRSAVKAALERANEAIESIVPFRGTIEEMERWAREAIQAGTESRLAGVRLAKVGFWKEVEGILSGEQREELKTRWFRSRGPLILVDEDVAEQVGLSADQRIAIRAVVRWSAVEMAKVDAEMRELWARFRLEGLDGPTGRDMAPLTRRKLEYIRRRNAILAELLEEEQKSAFARVRGAPFEWNGGGQGSATRRPGESSGSGTEGRKEGEAKAADKGDEQ